MRVCSCECADSRLAGADEGSCYAAAGGEHMISGADRSPALHRGIDTCRDTSREQLNRLGLNTQNGKTADSSTGRGSAGGGGYLSQIHPGPRGARCWTRGQPAHACHARPRHTPPD